MVTLTNTTTRSIDDEMPLDGTFINASSSSVSPPSLSRTMSRHTMDVVDQRQAMINSVQESFSVGFLAHNLQNQNQNDDFLDNKSSLHHALGGADMVSPWDAWQSKVAYSSLYACQSPSGARGGRGTLQKTCERKLQRMIKNRESAARSRIRKQAYTNQLELEIKDLREREKLVAQETEGNGHEAAFVRSKRRD